MIKTQGLTHLHLVVRDVQRSLAFYTQTLGLKVAFWKRGEAVGMGGGLGHFGFRLQRKGDLDKAVEETVAAGGKLLARGERALRCRTRSTPGQTGVPGQPYAYVTDPDGYVIEL